MSNCDIAEPRPYRRGGTLLVLTCALGGIAPFICPARGQQRTFDQRLVQLVDRAAQKTGKPVLSIAPAKTGIAARDRNQRDPLAALQESVSGLLTERNGVLTVYRPRAPWLPEPHGNPCQGMETWHRFAEEIAQFLGSLSDAQRTSLLREGRLSLAGCTKQQREAARRFFMYQLLASGEPSVSGDGGRRRQLEAALSSEKGAVCLRIVPNLFLWEGTHCLVRARLQGGDRKPLALRAFSVSNKTGTDEWIRPFKLVVGADEGFARACPKGSFRMERTRALSFEDLLPLMQRQGAPRAGCDRRLRPLAVVVSKGSFPWRGLTEGLSVTLALDWRHLGERWWAGLSGACRAGERAAALRRCMEETNRRLQQACAPLAGDDAFQRSIAPFRFSDFWLHNGWWSVQDLSPTKRNFLRASFPAIPITAQTGVRCVLYASVWPEVAGKQAVGAVGSYLQAFPAEIPGRRPRSSTFKEYSKEWYLERYGASVEFFP